jgi:cobalamin 5'-phosphate synthase/cobalamin synthase
MYNRVKEVLRSLLFAFGFLTIIPGLGRIDVDAEDMGKSSIFFPIVGLMLGAFVYLIGVIPVLSPLTRSIFINIFIILFTRGLHTDGVLDTFDGFLSGRRTGDEILSIMKDSRVGALGFVGTFFLYLLKIAILYEILLHVPHHQRSLLLLPTVMSRGGVAFYSFLFPAARVGSSLGRSFASGVRLHHVLGSFLLSQVISIRLGTPFTLLLPAFIFLFWFLWGLVCRRKIGGITGDTIGAGIEFAESLGFILVLIMVL